MAKFIESKSKFRKQMIMLAIWARKITLPGFDKTPLYDVSRFFWNGIVNGAISTRASAIAFSFFLAIFPAVIFFFTLIPYIPISNFQVELLKMLENIIPYNAYISVQNTLEDIATNKRGSLLSIGFIAALFFSTNGIAAMITAFNATVHTFESRTWIAQRLISVLLVIILTILLTIAVSLIIFSQMVLNYLVILDVLENNITYYLLLFGQWIIIIALFFFTISFLYYLAPTKKSEWRFISAGSTLATLLIIITSIGFSFYINHFGRYNKLYGSIGTLIVVLLWLYFNAFVLLIGFELNASISNAHLKKKKPLLLPEK
ncbi:MAG: YihY/virulence factor BrkB family protein [Bacteroidales bacterium]|nr:YihY/virulence factor BrkB family protein [Bacteroidales bacterium]